jgi:hypothetical protein
MLWKVLRVIVVDRCLDNKEDEIICVSVFHVAREISVAKSALRDWIRSRTCRLDMNRKMGMIGDADTRLLQCISSDVCHAHILFRHTYTLELLKEYTTLRLFILE